MYRKFIQAFLGAGLLCLVVVLGVGCAQINNTNESTDQMNHVKIGGLFSLTGFAAFAGESAHNGFIMALEDAGTDIVYVVEDFESDFAGVANAAKKLIDIDGVSVVIGPEFNEFSEIITPIATENQIPFISPWMTTEAEYRTSPYYFTATPSERAELRTLVTYLKEQSDAQHIVIVASNNAWSFENAKIFKEELAAHAPEIDIIEEFDAEHDTQDYRTIVTKIKQHSPDAVYTTISSGRSMIALAKQLTELGVDTQLYMPFSMADTGEFVDTHPELAAGVIYPAIRKHERADEFEQRYTERFGNAPAAVSAPAAYDMTTLVIEAINNGATTPDEIKDYLTGVENYNGYSNIISFDEYGQVMSGHVIIRQRTPDGSSKILQE